MKSPTTRDANSSNNLMIDATDFATPRYLSGIETERHAAAQKFSPVKTVLVVLSSAAMVFDVESLRQKIHLTYPEAAVFFVSTLGKPVGPVAPRRVDLVVDFSGPWQRGKWFHSWSLRSRARFTVGRNAGPFRSRIYTRVFDEKARMSQLPGELLAREIIVQREVLRLAGIPFAQTGDTPPDRGKITPLELPPLQRI